MGLAQRGSEQKIAEWTQDNQLPENTPFLRGMRGRFDAAVITRTIMLDWMESAVASDALTAYIKQNGEQVSRDSSHFAIHTAAHLFQAVELRQRILKRFDPRHDVPATTEPAGDRVPDAVAPVVTTLRETAAQAAALHRVYRTAHRWTTQPKQTWNDLYGALMQIRSVTAPFMPVEERDRAVKTTETLLAIAPLDPPDQEQWKQVMEHATTVRQLLRDLVSDDDLASANAEVAGIIDVAERALHVT